MLFFSEAEGRTFDGSPRYPSRFILDIDKDLLVMENPPSEELIKELQNHVKHATAPYKYPRIVEFVDELPKTLGGKIKRAEIRKEDSEKAGT